MATEEMSFTPLVILGAGRSGTNILRDTLVALDGFATWPCDEINPIWRHGNLSWPNDEIPPERAAGAPREYIRRAFRRIWREFEQPRFVVEKTCANTLRVPFVDAVLPEAKFIHIVRDGLDVVASAQKRWRGEMELPSLPYYWNKMRYVPLRELPVYGWLFLTNRIAIRRSSESRMDAWGPRFDGMRELSACASLDQICARQWLECIEKTDAALATLPPDRHMCLRYEDMTSEPEASLRSVLEFLEVRCDADEIARATAPISRRSVGKGRKVLSSDEEGALMELLRTTLARHGYPA